MYLYSVTKINVKQVILTFIVFIMTSGFAIGQKLTTDYNPTINALINTLVGSGITVSNISYTGDPSARGTFNGSSSNIGLNSGVILSTGMVSNASGPNDDPLDGSCLVQYIQKSVDFGRAGDPDLETIENCTGCTHDAAVLEFDFIPQSTPLTFKYVFASEEYPCYVCSTFNDIFAFLITGPNPSGGQYANKNIAIIPGTQTIVAINSVNSGTPGYDPIQQQYYPTSGCISLNYSKDFVNNGDGSTPLADPSVQYNGFTQPFTASIPVVPCQTYKIKLAIADVGDGLYDSAVLLQANSFTSNTMTVTNNFTNQAIDSVAVKGCNNAIVTFTLPKPPVKDTTITYTMSGTAINGQDYTQVTGSVVIKAGQKTGSFTIAPFKTGVTAGDLTAIVTVNVSSCKAQNFTIKIKQNPALQVSPGANAIQCKGSSASLTVNASGGVGKYTYQWNNSAGNNKTITVKPDNTTIYTVTVNDVCSNTGIVSVKDSINPNPVITPFETQMVCLGNSTTLIANASGSRQPYSYSWSNGASSQSITISPSVNQTITLTVTDANSCKSTATATVSVTAKPALSISSFNSTICKGTGVTITVSGANDFTWYANGNVTATGTTVTVTPTVTTTYTIHGSNGGNCTKDTTIVINVNKLSAVITLNPDTLCPNTSTTISVTGQNSEGYKYIWSNDTTKSSFLFTNTNTTTSVIKIKYTVTVTDNVGCSSVDSVNVFEFPDISKLFTITPDSGFTPLTVNFKYTGGNNVLWTFGDKTTSKQPSVSHIYYYDISRDPHGYGYVKDTVTIKIGICPPETKEIIVKIPVINNIPNVFTPNGDGRNDYFSIQGNGLRSAEVSIFNRWGAKIFSKTYDISTFTYDNTTPAGGGDYKNYIMWDGTNKNGNKVDDGVYFYVLKPVGMDGNSITPKTGKLSGSVTIMK